MVSDDSETFRLDNFESEVVAGACGAPRRFICLSFCYRTKDVTQNKVRHDQVHERTTNGRSGRGLFYFAYPEARTGVRFCSLETGTLSRYSD